MGFTIVSLYVQPVHVKVSGSPNSSTRIFGSGIRVRPEQQCDNGRSYTPLAELRSTMSMTKIAMQKMQTDRL